MQWPSWPLHRGALHGCGSGTGGRVACSWEDGTMPLGLMIAAGVLLLLLVIFSLVFTLVRRALVRQRLALEAEGVVLDTGPQWMTLRLQGYRRPGLYAGIMVKKVRGHLVLTKTHLTAVGLRWMRFEISQLQRFKVSVGEGGLRLHTDQPPEATGTLDLRVQIPDAEAWLKALKEVGAVEG
jgi:hypothetical protein